MVGGQIGISSTVESAHDHLTNSGCFHGIFRFDHSLRQTRQFVSSQVSFGVELIGKVDDTQLFFWIESLDFFDDLAGSHIETLS